MTQPIKTVSQLADASDNPQIGPRASSVTAAVVAHSITDAAADLSTANEAELEGFYDVLGARINDIISVLEEHGLIADN